MTRLPYGRLTALLLISLSMVWLLGGCASSPPSRFYVLTPMTTATAPAADIVGGPLSLGVGPVEFPQFLDRPQIVSRGGNRLQLDEFERWGGTLQDDFLRVWSENLAHLLGTSRVVVFPSQTRLETDFRVLAEVLGFEGVPDAAVLLKVRWAVFDGDLQRALMSREDVYRCPVRAASAGDLPALAAGNGSDAGADTGSATGARVAAMSRCLEAFSRDVAAAVRALPRPVRQTEGKA
ncbi:membrane integrity-associated transporter subunit PqiC [Thiohalocapsa marina]|uniref:Membrane integrity-associated transporter subunit PqiC n=1 Tax=Thiohalocapsa marina TaxID=424902 RepID=A0A5M8FT60_9GAMM|nr:PqiC family protein [Thiohalocapsa marina]KAA6186990.1 membrane integrity-associated transporter subunit PqiC [Thiohalocapsa marina]